MAKFPPQGTDAADCSHAGKVTATFSPATEVSVKVTNEGTCTITVEMGSSPAAPSDKAKVIIPGRKGAEGASTAEEVGHVQISCSGGEARSKCEYKYSIKTSD